MPLAYTGNGPYCSANSLCIVLGDDGPGHAAVEVLSGSPFGLVLHGDEELLYFSPPSWHPEGGLASAIDLIGWECDRHHGSRDDAVRAVLDATPDSPVLAGQIEMGLLPYIPGKGNAAIGVDHYLVVLGTEDGTVCGHDAQGWPFVTIELATLLEAWKADTFAFPVDPYTFRRSFRKVREFDLTTAVRTSLPRVVSLLESDTVAEVAERGARILDEGLSSLQWKFLAEFTVQSGARRLADAAVVYAGAGLDRAAAILHRQARLAGALQLPITTRDYPTAATILRKLGPTYDELRDSLVAELPG